MARVMCVQLAPRVIPGGTIAGMSLWAAGRLVRSIRKRFEGGQEHGTVRPAVAEVIRRLGSIDQAPSEMTVESRRLRIFLDLSKAQPLGVPRAIGSEAKWRLGDEEGEAIRCDFDFVDGTNCHF